MKKLVLAGLSLWAGACGVSIERYAKGGERTWVVIYTDELRRPATHLASEFFRVIETPQPETLYNFVFATPEEFEKNWKGYKNIIILATPSSESFKPFLQAFPDARMGLSEKRGGFVKDDYVIGILAGDEESLYGSLTELKPAIDSLIQERTSFLYSRLAFYAGVNKGFSKDIQKEYGFRIKLPNGWAFVHEEKDFLAMAKHNPDRFFFVYREDAPRSLDPKSLLDLRDELTAAFYDGDYVLRDMVHVEPGSFAGQPAVIIWGVWQNDNRTAGGPFKAICFNRDNRFYMLDMGVFAPEKPDKLGYLLRIETVLSTIRFQ